MGYPTEAQVEAGVVFGASNELEGTLDITSDNPTIPDAPTLTKIKHGNKILVTMEGDGVVRYVTDGTDASLGTIYNEPLYFEPNTPIKAISILDGHQSDPAYLVA